MISYFYIDSIAKMLTARPDNGITKSYKFKKSFDIIKMAKSSKILMPAEIKIHDNRGKKVRVR